MEQSGEELMNIMADKSLNEDEKNAAFQMFCVKYEKRLNNLVEGLCQKFGYSSEIAFKAVECTFARIRRYPSFSMKKSTSKNVDNAIILWLNKIAYTQVLKFKNSMECAEVSDDDDLAVVNDVTEFYEVVSKRQFMSEKEKEYKIRWLDAKLSCMKEKHRIVLLTYLAYETR